MVGGPSIIFCRCAEVGVSKIRSHKYQDPNTCKIVTGFNANSLYLYCSSREMHCGKEEYVQVENLQTSSVIKDLCDKVMKDELFGFIPVDIHIPNELQEKFSEFSSSLV